jgi:DNA-binding CsgD family transcriptional regulator
MPGQHDPRDGARQASGLPAEGERAGQVTIAGEDRIRIQDPARGQRLLETGRWASPPRRGPGRAPPSSSALTPLGTGTLASYLISADRQPGQGREYRLSPRELEVLGLLAAGEKDRDIAQQLFITTATVHSHLERIRDKTGARRRVELAREFLDHQPP